MSISEVSARRQLALQRLQGVAGPFVPVAAIALVALKFFRKGKGASAPKVSAGGAAPATTPSAVTQAPKLPPKGKPRRQVLVSRKAPPQASNDKAAADSATAPAASGSSAASPAAATSAAAPAAPAASAPSQTTSGSGAPEPPVGRQASGSAASAPPPQPPPPPPQQQQQQQQQQASLQEQQVSPSALIQKEPEQLDISPDEEVLELFNEDEVDIAGGASEEQGQEQMLKLLQSMGFRVVMANDGSGQAYVVPPGADESMLGGMNMMDALQEGEEGEEGEDEEGEGEGLNDDEYEEYEEGEGDEDDGDEANNEAGAHE